jgi:hypothetical protein
MNTSVEPSGDNVHTTIVGRDVEHDVQVIAGELTEFWCEHGRHSDLEKFGKPNEEERQLYYK